MSRARELAKAGGVQQRIAGFSSHVGMSTFLAAVHMENNLTVDGNIGVGGNLTVTGTTTFNGGTLTLGDANTDNVVFGGEVDSNIIPDDDNTFDLGSSSKEWKDLYVDGVAYLDSVESDGGSFGNIQVGETGDNEIDTGSGNLTLDSAGGTVAIDDNLTVSGDVDLGDATSDTITATGRFDSDLVPSTDGARDLGTSDLEWQDLFIDGTAQIDSLVADTADINGGTIDGAAIGSASATTAAFTTISASGNVDFNGDLDVDGTTNLDVVDIDGAVDMASNLVIAGNIDANGNLDVDGTTDLDATNVVGTLTVTGDIAADNVTINGNTVSTSSGNLTIDSNGGTTTIADDAVISGNLTVNGTTTTINSTTVAIDDKNFQVATGAADDAAANGAGFTIDSGDGDKTINFEATGDNFGFSENINLASGKVLKVNNSEILSGSALSSNITVPNGSIPNSGVSAGSYGGSSAIPVITVDAKGFVTSATTSSIDSTQIAQLNTSVACSDTGSDGLVTVTADGSTVAVFDQNLLTVTGSILPDANGTRDLGASGTRWANVYSSDLDLSNQAKGANSVDGTWGSYLIEEGEDHLFLTNRRSGKKFRFVLEEV